MTPRGAHRAGPIVACVGLLASISAAAETLPAPAEVATPVSILDLQPFTTEAAVQVQATDGATGTATLLNLNPNVNAWFVLSLDFGPGRPREAYHLENARRRQLLSLVAGPRGQIIVDFGDGSAQCPLLLTGRNSQSLDAARDSGLPYAPLCGARLYMRNPTTGRASTLEKVTGFLRDHVWGGERIVTFVKKELYNDAFREQSESAPALQPDTGSAPAAAPDAALIEPGAETLAVDPPHLGIDVDAPGPELRLGRWYALRGLDDAYFSVIEPDAIRRDLYSGREAGVNLLTGAESTALAYFVAFDLARFELRFALGTDHPRLGWSPRPPPASHDPNLPGPDGIDSPAPLVNTGMVPPVDSTRTVAAFAGGFKREHGAFRVGPLAERNHGSHYGFIEDGVVFSKLQPGLATVYTTVSGEVQMKTWSASDAAQLASIRDARQNGVPLIDYDPRRHAGVPGALVNAWSEGNWSGSATEDLRTVRAGLCLQDVGSRRFLLYAYFSSASPSAMARVFQAFRCSYAMHLDMNALEHTYFAAYVSQDGRRTVEHLIDGMDVLDRHIGDVLAPRFAGFPDNRDFFYVVRREEP